MSPVTIRTRKVRLDDHQAPNTERTLILVSSNTGKATQIKTSHVPAILNHTRHVISQQVPQIQPKTVIVSRAKTPLILADTNKVNTPRATVIYAGSRPISPKTIVTPQNTSQVTRIVTSASTPNKTFPTQTFKIPSPPPRKTFVNIVSSRPTTTHTSSNSVESRLQQQTPSRPARPGTPAPWSSAAEDDLWSRPCTPRPPSSFRVPRSRWPSVDPSYEAPKLPSPEKPKGSSYPSACESDAPHVVSTTDDNGNIVKQEIKTELNEENIDSIPISVVLAPYKRPMRVENPSAKKKTKISIAQDNKLGPVKEHVNTVFEHYGVTASFSPNMEKLVEITGSTALNYLLYVDWCKKKCIRTVNQETYGRLFRNEFKKLVGTR